MASHEYALLARIPGLDAALWQAIAPRLGTPQALTRQPAAELAAFGLTRAALRALAAFDPKRHEADMLALERHDLILIAADEPAYPPALLAVRGAPPVLFVRGSAEVLLAPQLAMVGSRHPTAIGARTARDLAFHFASVGLVITSGLAIGIDAASHGGALAADGRTIAVCGTGLDRIYPPSHCELAERIAANGALVSEFPPGSAPLPHHFVQRNRLISGLSLGVLVVEAAAHSGSLSTARHAGDQGREVFAIPGSIHSPQSRGCHQLLRQGAKLVENADDVLNEFKNILYDQLLKPMPIVYDPPSGRALPLDNPAEILLDAIGFEPTSLDALIASTGLSSTSVASLLLSLEQQGRVASDSAGHYFRVPDTLFIDDSND